MQYFIVRNLLDDNTFQHWSGDADDINHARGLAKAEIEGDNQIYEEIEAYELPL